VFENDQIEEDPNPATVQGLRALLELQRDTIIAVATGSPMKEHKEGYGRRRRLLRSALKTHGLADPFPWASIDLVWAWAKQWSSYAERRSEVAKIATPTLDRLDEMEEAGRIDDWGGAPDHWGAIEERLAGLRREMDNAKELDDFQDVGRRGREIVIAAVNEMFQAYTVPEGTEEPKVGDAKRRFELVVQSFAPGSSHAELRSLMRAAWDLSQKVTHGTITRVDAFAAAQSTVLLVRTLAEMHGAGRS
jgi:hypothetical protein